MINRERWHPEKSVEYRLMTSFYTPFLRYTNFKTLKMHRFFT